MILWHVIWFVDKGLNYQTFLLLWKVRVPRLKGGKMGVLATRSPHRPNPIGLSVAKV